MTAIETAGQDPREPSREGAFGGEADRNSEDIRAKRALYEAEVAARNWIEALVVVERPYRPEYLLRLIEQHGAERLLPAAGHFWQDTESAFADGDTWASIWDQVLFTRRGQPRKTRYRVMSRGERATFSRLPDTLTIYRGYRGDGGHFGMSWTIDRGKAEWFARRFGDGEPFVATAIISKADVLAYFTRESEILVDQYRLDWDAIRREPLSEQSSK